ncbi:hypothetical protein ACWIB8_02825 [Corynebacterium flavescens]
METLSSLSSGAFAIFDAIAAIIKPFTTLADGLSDLLGLIA